MMRPWPTRGVAPLRKKSLFVIALLYLLNLLRSFFYKIVSKTLFRFGRAKAFKVHILCTCYFKINSTDSTGVL